MSDYYVDLKIRTYTTRQWKDLAYMRVVTATSLMIHFGDKSKTKNTRTTLDEEDVFL